MNKLSQLGVGRFTGYLSLLNITFIYLLFYLFTYLFIYLFIYYCTECMLFTTEYWLLLREVSGLTESIVNSWKMLAAAQAHH